jgi:hypothetical protein
MAVASESKSWEYPGLGYASLEQLLEFADNESEKFTRASAEILWCKLGRLGFTENGTTPTELINLDDLTLELAQREVLSAQLGPTVTTFINSYVEERSKFLEIPLDNRGEVL